MSNNKTNQFEEDLLDLIFNNTNIGSIGDTTGLQGSSTAGNFYIALGDTDVTETCGSGAAPNTEPTTGPGEYGEYTRQAVPRSTAGWTVSTTGTGTAENFGPIQWTTMSTGTGFTVDYVGICKGSTINTADFLYFGTSSQLVIGNGVQPTIAAGALDITEE
jgi:hypothetical protein